MRTHLLQITGRFLLPLVLAGCQETPTDSQRDETTSTSTGSPTMSPSVSGAKSGAQVFHYVANGDHASVNWTTPEPDASGNSPFGFLSYDDLGNPEIGPHVLFYFVGQCDAFNFCTVFESGSGNVNEGLTRLGGRGTVSKGVRLTTNTSNNPSFAIEAGTGGPISVEWVPTGLSEERFTGHSDLKYGLAGFPITQHFQGTATLFHASATGSVVGLPILPFQAADFGSTKSRTVSIEHH